MKTLLPMNGGINRDANPLYIASDRGDVYDRRNCRVYSFDGNRTGINVSIKGMTEVSASLPSGTNIIIGYVQDKERDCGIFFNYNSNGNDGIYIFTGSLVINLGVPNGVLGFSPFYFVRASVIGDYCVFTDNLNPPRKIQFVNDDGDFQINLLSGKSADDIQLINRPPSSAPTFVVGSDSSKKSNRLIGKSFQFAYYYIYSDNTYSVLSPYSDLLVAPSMFTGDKDSYVDQSLGNHAVVSYNVGYDSVSEVVLVAREGNSGNWFVVDKHEKDSEDELSVISTVFYNDVARVGVQHQEVDSFFSDVPLLAKSVSIVQNRVALANVLKGYDKTNVDFSVSVAYEDYDLNGLFTDMTNSDEISSTNYIIKWTIPTALIKGQIIKATFSGRFKNESSYDFDFYYSFSVVVESGDVVSDIINKFVADITSKGNGIITTIRKGTFITASPYQSGSDVGIQFLGVAGSGSEEYSYSGTFTQETIVSGVNTFKAGSYYEVGVVLCDEHSRTSGVLSKKKIYIPSAGERDFADAYKRAYLNFTINNTTAPSWAKYLRFVVTESVSFSGVFNTIVGASSVEAVNDGKDVFAISLSESLDYAFTDGDYVLIESISGSSITTIQKTCIGTRTIVYDSASNEYSGFFLLIPNEGESILDFAGNKLTIYRPKSDIENNVFFEDVNTYSVTNGVIQITSGTIDNSDAWIINRQFSVTFDIGLPNVLQGIRLNTGTSGTAQFSYGSITGVFTFYDDYETTIKRFVAQYGNDFLTNGLVVAADGSDLLVYEPAGASTSPTITNLTGDLDGDTLLINEARTGVLYATVEDFYIDIYTGLRAYARGRSIVELSDLSQIRLQDFVWSFNYLDNTKINGMSTFNPLNRKQLDEKNGQINAISVVGDVVKVIQDNKETSLYIGKARFVDGDGTIGLVKSNDFIGDAYPSVSDYGSRYPNSVSTNNRDVYYFDGDRGQVIRSSANGQFPISDYGMKSEFLRIKRDMDNALGVDSRSVKIISFYDVRNDEYVITFDIRGNVETWAFKEGADQWVARYDFEDASGNAPSLYGNVGEQALSFLNGSVWLHERSTSYNTFYGDLKPLSVTGLLNIYPEQEKCLRAVKIDSNRAMDTTITSPVANTRPVGQKSLLYAESYSLREGSYTSAVYGNILGAGGVENLSLLHSGDDMVGKYLQLTFSDESASEMQLRLVTASFTINR
jgi:hypothetical protein